MSIEAYIQGESLFQIVPYRNETPKDAIAFVGTLRKHPYDGEKCLLIADPAGRDPAIFEFKIADVVSAQEMPSPVDTSGQSRSLAKLWVRRGSFGIRYEPFEVDDPLKRPGEPGPLHERLMKSVRN